MALPCRRLRDAVANRALHAIGLAVGNATGLFDFLLVQLIQVALTHAENSSRTTHPQPATIIFNDCQHLITEESLLRRILCKAASENDSNRRSSQSTNSLPYPHTTPALHCPTPVVCGEICEVAVIPTCDRLASKAVAELPVRTGNLTPPRRRVECPLNQIGQRICADGADGTHRFEFLRRQVGEPLQVRTAINDWRSTFSFVLAIHSHSLKLLPLYSGSFGSGQNATMPIATSRTASATTTILLRLPRTSVVFSLPIKN
jgi:hypothetical protein